MKGKIIIKAIGRIETQFKNPEDLKIPPYKEDSPYNDPSIWGTLHIFEEYREGIKDLQAGSSAMLIFHFNKSKAYTMVTNSPSFEKPVGVFSTRSPNRPNGIGVTIVNIISIDDSKIVFQGVDMLDGTPLLDIKPYGRDRK